MRLLLSFLFVIPFAGIAQTTLQASSKIIVDDGYDYTELSVTSWGGSHGIFFGSKVSYTGSQSLWYAGNEQDKEIKNLKVQNNELQDIKKELEIIKAKLQTKN